MICLHKRAGGKSGFPVVTIGAAQVFRRFVLHLHAVVILVMTGTAFVQFSLFIMVVVGKNSGSPLPVGKRVVSSRLFFRRKGRCGCQREKV
jgi:hypothetical protein